MAIIKDFGNTVSDQKEKKKKIDKLTVLKESDARTIYNLFFSEKKTAADVRQS